MGGRQQPTWLSKLTDEQRAYFELLIETPELSGREIAELMGTTATTVYTTMRKHYWDTLQARREWQHPNPKPRRNRWQSEKATEEREARRHRDRAIETLLIDPKVTYTEVGAIYGLSKQRTYQILKNRNPELVKKRRDSWYHDDWAKERRSQPHPTMKAEYARRRKETEDRAAQLAAEKEAQKDRAARKQALVDQSTPGPTGTISLDDFVL